MEQTLTNNVILYTARKKLQEITTEIKTQMKWLKYDTRGIYLKGFSTEIISHEFSSGKGMIVFAEPIREIGKYAFYECKELTSIFIPDSVTEIGYSAFAGCGNLRTINIPDSVTEIGDYAFEGCRGLKSISIPDSVTEIGDFGVEGCEGLISPVYNSDIFAYMPRTYKGAYTIPNGIKRINSWAFGECHDLTSVNIPDSVTEIGVDAFNGCEGLESVHLGRSVIKIGAGAFQDCSALKSVNIPDTVVEIDEHAFSGCNELSSIILPSSVTTIGDYAFEFCKFTSIQIPDSVTKIGERAFDGCFLEEGEPLTIPKSVSKIKKRAFDGCSEIVIIQSPFICSKRYTQNTSLKDIFGKYVENFILGDEVTEIGDYAFSRCKIETITIPKSVIKIGKGAFNECNNLREIKCEAVNPPALEAMAFSGLKTSILLYVPKNSLELYLKAEQWKDLINIEAVE